MPHVDCFCVDSFIIIMIIINIILERNVNFSSKKYSTPIGDVGKGCWCKVEFKFLLVFDPPSGFYSHFSSLTFVLFSNMKIRSIGGRLKGCFGVEITPKTTPTLTNTDY